MSKQLKDYLFYQDDWATIYCGDCLEIMPLMERESVDLVVTDPPYFLPVQSYVGTREKGYPERTLADTSILKGYFERFFGEIHKTLNKKATYYVFCDAQSYPIFYQVMFPYCSHVRLIIWDKLISFNGYTWRHQHELISWGELDETERIPTGDGDILKFRGVLQENRNHPAEKPEQLLSTLIKKHSTNIIFDPFLGSGTTCVAAKNLNRKSIGIEINPKYCEIAVKRLRQEVFDFRKEKS